MKENGSTFGRSERGGEASDRTQRESQNSPWGRKEPGFSPTLHADSSSQEPAAPTMYPGVTRFCRAPNSGEPFGSQAICHD